MENYDSLKEKIEKLESFDFSNFDNNKFKIYKTQFFSTFKDIATIPTLNIATKGNKFSRARISKDPNDFNYLNEMWYPPQNIQAAGRLNYPQDRLLYTAENDTTAIIEIQPKRGDFISIINFEIKGLNEFKCLDFGFINNEEKKKIFKESKEKLFHDFICRKCKEIIQSNEKYKYSPTILAAKSISGSLFDAYGYLSVATNFSAINLAFKPKFADKYIKFKDFRVIQVTNKIGNQIFEVKCLYHSNQITSKNQFVFDSVENCGGHIIDSKNSLNNNTHT